MRLQADPTVGYSLGIGPRSRLYLRQLRVESPFNTYLFEGLPPGPICNPGRAAIDAVLNPTSDVKYLYFVARGEGRHLFAATYAEHLKNIQRARAMIAAQRGAASLESEALEATRSLAAESAAVATVRPAPAETVAHGKPHPPAPDTTAHATHATKSKSTAAGATSHATKSKSAAADTTHHAAKPKQKSAAADTTHHAAKPK